VKLTRHGLHSEMIEKIERISGEEISKCYQCGKCSAGCPVAQEMGTLPNRVVRHLQLGQDERAFEAEAVWFCTSCHTCESRCPKGFDLSRVMEALRAVLLRRGEAPVRPEDLPAELFAAAPQQAIVSCYRKYVS